MHDLTFALQLTKNTEQFAAQKFAALTLGQVAMHDDIGHTGFIFEGNEDHAAGGANVSFCSKVERYSTIVEVRLAASTFDTV